METSIPARHPVFADDEMGIGTWAWGDRLYWGFGRDYDRGDVEAVFDACLSMGLTFFDTAEVYGQGTSETFLGQFIQKSHQKNIRLASKFMPFPWRLWKASLTRALKGTLKRLGVEKLDLYQIHWPVPPVSIETWMDAMTEACQNGLIGAVGVSNFDRSQMLRAFERLGREGIMLASNQVEYSLINRKVEKNGLLKICQERGITLIAYSPLGGGLLTGKYTPENPIQGVRGQRYNQKYLTRLQKLIRLMREIGSEHDNRSPAQVAINWTICKGAFPIPGAKTMAQAEQNSGAIGWRLTEAEVERLDQASEHLGEEGD